MGLWHGANWTFIVWGALNAIYFLPLLLLGKNISETCYECGFESLSYFNRTFKTITTENPSSFKKRNQNHIGNAV